MELHLKQYFCSAVYTKTCIGKGYMKNILIFFFLLIAGINTRAQDFIGVARYKLSVIGAAENHTDSMTVVFDKGRIMVILYLPGENKVAQKIFVDDFSEAKSYRVDPEKKSYEVDSLKAGNTYEFINTNKIGAVNNNLCIRYNANMNGKDKSVVNSAECLAAIDYRFNSINNYQFLGIQPIVVDNRIVMDFTEYNSNGTKPNIVLVDISKMENVESYFDFWGYREVHQ